jgi:two-component system phosphate regulon response regulator PhoB
MNSKYKVLIVEDETDIRELMCMQLELQHYKVHSAKCYHDAKELIAQHDFNLFLIDRMLPDANGLDLCKELRSNLKTKHKALILVTALCESENIIEGLDAGADDYITKPFDIDILHARVRSQLRRVSQAQNIDNLTIDSTERRFNKLTIDVKKCRVKVDEHEVSLTSTEFQILSELSTEPGTVYTRQRLIHKIIGEDVHVTNRTIDTHIAGLRKKLGICSNLIETIRGIGYRLKDNE